MRIAELSRRAEVPIPTIKFYIREGMLPRGERSSATQARYGQTHLDRLTLIATLQKAGLTLPVIAQALRTMDSTPGDSPEFMAVAVGALPVRDYATSPEQTARAETVLRALVEQRGWDVSSDAPVWQAAVRAIAGLVALWPEPVTPDRMAVYAEVAERLAAVELPDGWNPSISPAEALRYAVLGTVLFEPVILSLRRLAHVDRGAKLRARRGSTS